MKNLESGLCRWKIQVQQKNSRGYTLSEKDKECDICNGYTKICSDYLGLTTQQRFVETYYFRRMR